MLLLSMPGNEEMGEALSRHLAARSEVVAQRRFPDGESLVQLPTGVVGSDVVLVCTLDRPDDKYLPLMFAADAAREQGARSVTLVAPYLCYMRQDRAFHDGEAVTAPAFARAMSSWIDALVTMDPHLHRIEELGEVYTVPARNVHAAPSVAAWITSNVEAPVLVGPDVESGQWISDVAARIGAPHVALEKVRRGDHDVEISTAALGAYPGRTAVIVDDIISTAGTMARTVRAVRAAGYPSPHCVGVHAIFAADAAELLRAAGPASVVTTNTIVHPSNAIDVSHLLAAAVKDVHSERGWV